MQSKRIRKAIARNVMMIAPLAIAGGVVYDIVVLYPLIDPPETAAEERRLKENEKVKEYIRLGRYSLGEAAEKPEVVKRFQTLLDEPAVQEYRGLPERIMQLRQQYIEAKYGNYPYLPAYKGVLTGLGAAALAGVASAASSLAKMRITRRLARGMR